MKKIAVINDLSGLGKCSLTAAIPVISAMGVQAVPLPTAVLSNQTGYESYFCDVYTDRMDAIMEEWEKRHFWPDGIYTGFLAGASQAEKILEFFRRFRTEDTMVLVDPVLGDQGATYDIYSEELCESMRKLAEQAQVITPNYTEALLLLYGKEGMETHYKKMTFSEIEQTGAKLCERFKIRTAVVTGIEQTDECGKIQMGNLVYQDGKASWIFSEKNGGSYSGTGDLFASVLSAGLVKGISMEKCAKKAVNFLTEAIKETVEEGTDRNDGVCFESFLYKLME